MLESYHQSNSTAGMAPGKVDPTSFGWVECMHPEGDIYYLPAPDGLRKQRPQHLQQDETLTSRLEPGYWTAVEDIRQLAEDPLSCADQRMEPLWSQIFDENSWPPRRSRNIIKSSYLPLRPLPPAILAGINHTILPPWRELSGGSYASSNSRCTGDEAHLTDRCSVEPQSEPERRRGRPFDRPPSIYVDPHDPYLRPSIIADSPNPPSRLYGHGMVGPDPRQGQLPPGPWVEANRIIPLQAGTQTHGHDDGNDTRTLVRSQEIDAIDAADAFIDLAQRTPLHPDDAMERGMLRREGSRVPEIDNDDDDSGNGLLLPCLDFNGLGPRTKVVITTLAIGVVLFGSIARLVHY